jgi:integrase
VTKSNGPVSANHCARVVRAAYKRAGRRDISLPSRLPTSAVEFNDETPSQKALDFKKFPAWLKAWRKIDSATRQAYHLTELLTGTRPGELARLRWADAKDNEHCALHRGRQTRSGSARLPPFMMTSRTTSARLYT